MRNCEGVPHGRTDKNDRYSFLKRIQMWQRLRHCDAGMDMVRRGAAVDRRCRPVPKSLEKIFEFGTGRTRIARKRIGRFSRFNIVFRFSWSFIMYFRRTQSLLRTRTSRINCGPLRARIYRIRLCYVGAPAANTGLICISARRSTLTTTRFASLRVTLSGSFDTFSFVSRPWRVSLVGEAFRRYSWKSRVEPHSIF